MANNSPQAKRTSQLKRIMASHASAIQQGQPLQKKANAQNASDVIQMNPSGIIALGTTGAIAGALLVGGPIAILIGLTVGGVAGKFLTGSWSDRKVPAQPLATTPEDSKEPAKAEAPATAYVGRENKPYEEVSSAIAEVKTLTDGNVNVFQNVKSLINRCNNLLIETKITYESTALFTATPLLVPIPKNRGF